MNQLGLRYPTSPGSKKVGTSSDAGTSMAARAQILRKSVLEVLKVYELTSDEVAEHLGESVLSIRPRLSELVKKGLIVETGSRRQNKSGKYAAVWRAK